MQRVRGLGWGESERSRCLLARAWSRVRHTTEPGGYHVATRGLGSYGLGLGPRAGSPCALGSRNAPLFGCAHHPMMELSRNQIHLLNQAFPPPPPPPPPRPAPPQNPPRARRQGEPPLRAPVPARGIGKSKDTASPVPKSPCPRRLLGSPNQGGGQSNSHHWSLDPGSLRSRPSCPRPCGEGSEDTAVALGKVGSCTETSHVVAPSHSDEPGASFLMGACHIPQVCWGGKKG